MRVSLTETLMEVDARQAAQVRSIASLKRGLDILSLVQQGEGMVLRELHAVSGVPKASLLRILKTLMEHELVRRRVGDGAYLGAHPAREKAFAGAIQGGAGASATTTDDRGPRSLGLAEAVAHLLVDLKKALAWPSDVAVVHRQTMRVIDSNRSGYGRAWHPSVIGEEVDLMDSAMGRAYLAFSPIAVRQPLIEGLLALGGARARRREALAQELEATRRRGYAARDHLYAGPDTHHGRQLSSVAVPILVGDRVAACVSCVWSTGTTSRAEVVEQSLVHLVRGACRVGAILHNPP